MYRLLLLTLFSVAAMVADPITFTLVEPDLVGTPGQTLTWDYDVVNNSGGTIDALAINADPFVDGTPDASVFDFFGSGIPNGHSLTGPLFAFDADPTIANSFNSGTFDLLVFTGTGTEDLFADYSVTIRSATSAVPEPSGVVLLLGCAFLVRQRMRARAQR
jgi:hypothetical protein